MRGFLERNRDRLGEPSIPRVFELDTQLRPTRTQVLVDNPHRYNFRSGWVTQECVLDKIDRCHENGDLIREFINAGRWQLQTFEQAPWILDIGRLRNDHRHSGILELPLREVYEQVLAGIVLPNAEEHTEWQVALAMIASALERYQDLVANIFMMRPESQPFRSLDEQGQIKQVFAGAFPGEPPYAYAGDREVRLGDLTLQVHHFDIGSDHQHDRSASTEVLAERVPVLALWMGERVNRPMLRQDQVLP